MADDAATIALLQGPLQLGRGRRAKQIRCTYTRDLTMDDLLLAATEGTGLGNAYRQIKDLRQSHHMLARLIAQGVDVNEIAIITGYTPVRISMLKTDPTFENLLQYYKDMEAQQYAVARADMHERLRSLGFDAIETLHQKLLDEPDSFDPKTLLSVVEAMSDRTGHGKTSTVNHEHLHALSDEAIARIKSAGAEARPLAEADRSALLRLATERTAILHPEGEEADWIEGSGELVREEGGEGNSAETAFR